VERDSCKIPYVLTCESILLYTTHKGNHIAIANLTPVLIQLLFPLVSIANSWHWLAYFQGKLISFIGSYDAGNGDLKLSRHKSNLIPVNESNKRENECHVSHFTISMGRVSRRSSIDEYAASIIPINWRTTGQPAAE